MAMTIFVTLCVAVTLLCAHHFYPILFSLSKPHIPGPRLFSLSRWRLALEDWRGTRTRTIDRLHAQLGSVVRIGPNEVYFNSLSAMRTIYGAGSGFQRSDFYQMFKVYGRDNLFTFHAVKAHGDRKKLLAHAYSKSLVLKGAVAEMVEQKVRLYLALVEIDMREHGVVEVFKTLHYYSIDTITKFLYGSRFGGTSALQGTPSHRALLNDILNPERRRLSWFAIHLPAITRWMYTRSGLFEKMVTPMLPMRKPATYTGIRAHALQAWQDCKTAHAAGKLVGEHESTIIGHLMKSHNSQKAGGLDDLDIASECADHLLAGIDTTSDTLMFLIWALSLPENREFQDKLIAEVRELAASALNSSSIPTVEGSSNLRYLDAVIKETLRLYAPLPASEPRYSESATVIDGYEIPPNTIVAMSPYSLHRNLEIFEDPLKFDPERWLEHLQDAAKLAEMKKWFWAFSSGGRMCIGIHLAMAEMTTLAAAVYRKYTTSIAPRFEGVTPAITSRFEIFYDETFPNIQESNCPIVFRAHEY